MSSGQPLYVPDGERLERPLAEGGMLPSRATASAPVAAAGELRGALSVSMRSRALRLGLRQLELLGGLADLVGSSLLHGPPLAPGPVDAIRKLVSDLEEADPQTAKHSDEVSRLAVRVGAALGLSGVELLELELGSRLHDVGKLRVPPAILRKPGPLTDAERDVMGLHALWGWVCDGSGGAGDRRATRSERTPDREPRRHRRTRDSGDRQRARRQLPRHRLHRPRRRLGRHQFSRRTRRHRDQRHAV